MTLESMRSRAGKPEGWLQARVATVPLGEKESHPWGEVVIPDVGLRAEAAQGSPQHPEAGGAGVVHLRMRCRNQRCWETCLQYIAFIREGTESGPHAQPEAFPRREPLPALQAHATRLGFGAYLCSHPRLTCHSSRRLCTAYAASPSASMIPGSPTAGLRHLRWFITLKPL